MSKLLIIFGNISTGEEAFILAKKQCKEFDNVEAIYFDEAFEKLYIDKWRKAYKEVYFLISMVNQEVRSKCLTFAETQDMIPYTLIHPSAVIEPSATIGEGCYICQYAVISINAKIGNHCIIHIHSSIGHDVTIGDHSIVYPGARIGGNVNIGKEVSIGSNSFVHQGKTIGEGSQVDAMTYVDKNLPSKVLKSVRAKFLIDLKTKKPIRK